MQVAMNTVVTMTYELKNSDGEVLESSADPVAYLHGGYDNTLPKIEEALDGQDVGFATTLKLAAADAFGLGVEVGCAQAEGHDHGQEGKQFFHGRSPEK